MEKIATTLKATLLVAVVLLMTQSCIPTAPAGGNPTPTNLSGKIKSIQNFTYLDGFPASVTVQVNFKYDSIGRPNEIETVQGGSVAGKYKVIYAVNSTTLISQPGYSYSQHGITKTTYFIQPNTHFIDSVYQTMNDSILYIRELIERNNLDEIVRINTYCPIVASNLTHIVLDNFVYNNGNVIAYRYTDAYNSVFNLNFSYDMSKIQKPFTNTYSNINFLRSAFLAEGFGAAVNLDNAVDFLGLSYGHASVNLISLYTSESVGLPGNSTDTIQYTTYTDLLVKTAVKRYSSPFNPSMYFNSFSQNTYY